MSLLPFAGAASDVWVVAFEAQMVCAADLRGDHPWSDRFCSPHSALLYLSHEPNSK